MVGHLPMHITMCNTLLSLSWLSSPFLYNELINSSWFHLLGSWDSYNLNPYIPFSLPSPQYKPNHYQHPISELAINWGGNKEISPLQRQSTEKPETISTRQQKTLHARTIILEPVLALPLYYVVISWMCLWAKRRLNAYAEYFWRTGAHAGYIFRNPLDQIVVPLLLLF